jgi:hypothetical protein
LPIYEKWEKSLKMDEKLSFAHLWKMGKVAKNGRKVKAMALLFLLILALRFQKTI